MSSLSCPFQRDGSVELFFYEELDPAARDRMAAHVSECAECAAALGELRMIRQALAARPDISAPPDGDWTRFMERLDAGVRGDVAGHRSVAPGFSRNVASGFGRTSKRASFLVGLKPDATRGLLATAALLAIVTVCVLFVAKGRWSQVGHPVNPMAGSTSPDVVDATSVATSGLKSVSEKHLERSKLVVFGLAAKEPAGTLVSDWAYERELATSLLNDTRLYRLAAEERGLTSLAGVMRDLELVLLETSMAEGSDKAALGNIQRLIRKRGLIEKMDATATVGM